MSGWLLPSQVSLPGLVSEGTWVPQNSRAVQEGEDGDLPRTEAPLGQGLARVLRSDTSGARNSTWHPVGTHPGAVCRMNEPQHLDWSLPNEEVALDEPS